MSITRLLAAATLTLAALTSATPAQSDRAVEYNLDKGLALQGYDPVAYFAEGGGKPREGSKRITHTHEGVTYRFATDANKKLFVGAPERFEPAYGGWCAWAMSEGQRAPIDPESFRVFRNRLFVFYDGLFNDTRSKWLKDEAGRMAKADKNWKKESGESPPKLGRSTAQHNLGESGLAIQGYDPVAYFPEGGSAPKKGSEKYALTHDGVSYRFASAKNKAAFEANPSKYEPLYGGWCAYAIADDAGFVDINPKSYVIRDNGLHLYYDGFLGDTRALWQKDDAGYSRKAESQWKTIQKTGKRP